MILRKYFDGFSNESYQILPNLSRCTHSDLCVWRNNSERLENKTKTKQLQKQNKTTKKKKGKIKECKSTKRSLATLSLFVKKKKEKKKKKSRLYSLWVKAKYFCFCFVFRRGRLHGRMKTHPKQPHSFRASHMSQNQQVNDLVFYAQSTSTVISGRSNKLEVLTQNKAGAEWIQIVRPPSNQFIKHEHASHHRHQISHRGCKQARGQKTNKTKKKKEKKEKTNTGQEGR